ncbi:zinc dependent phospholipase C family protein [Peptococcaceae bacterium 1198_IL3148]
MNKITWNACKALLSVAAPIQRIIDHIPGDTHTFINKQAIIILYNDGHKKLSRYFHNQLGFINEGVVWADKGWKNFSHYFDPYKNKGIWPWPDAKNECNYHFKRAVHYWQQGVINKSMFYLGAAVHLVQDMCVPHHARGIPFKGHSRYEKWVQNHYLKYTVNKCGCYDISNDSVNNWIDNNAKLAWGLYPQVTGSVSENAYHQITTITLSQAQKTTAGFLLFFIKCVTNPSL